MSSSMFPFLPFASRHPRPATVSSFTLPAAPTRTTLNASLWRGRGLVTLSIGLFLIAFHLTLMILSPPWLDDAVYPTMGCAILLCSWAFYLHGRAANATASVRWFLFAAALGVHGLNYVRAGLGSRFGPALAPHIGKSFNSLDAVLQATTSALIILALTMPSGERSLPERVLDITVATTFSAIRIVDIFAVINAANSSYNLLLRFSFENGIYLLLTLIALGASSKEDLSFFKAAIVFRIGSLIALVFTNHVGFQWLHNAHANPWALSATVLRAATAIYLLNGLPVPTHIPVSPAQRAVIHSIVPFSMGCFLIWVSSVVITKHQALGFFGIAVGLGSFLVRTALSTPGSVPEQQSARLDSLPALPDALDSLNSIENRAGFQRTLEAARSTVSPARPLSVILFGIENASDLVEKTNPSDDTYLISIGRTLCQWHASGRMVCYMGNARFAMVLPSTSHTVALSLAECICTTLEAVRPPGPAAPIFVDAGVAEAFLPDHISDLLGLAMNSLIRAQMNRQEHRRPAASISDYPTDA